jgi:hypothetical protein
MACPFFKPLRRLDSGGWTPAPRLPLGGAWAGECVAGGAGELTEAVQRDLCNCGYARGRCDRFPASAIADAVRFSAIGGHAAGDNRLIYIFEKDHAPVEHGHIDAGHDLREPLASQARAFIESDRQRRVSPKGTAQSA